MLGRRKSFAETILGRRRAARRLVVLCLAFVCFELVSGLFFSNYSIRSRSMEPTLIPGDRLIATPLAFGPPTLFGKLPGIARPARGDVVVVDPGYARPPGFWASLADSFVRFVTFQLVSPAYSRPSRGDPEGILSTPTLQRVVGLPGDTIRMDDFVFRVRPAGSDQFLTEFELSTSRYDISHEDAPAGWRSDLPGSGLMEARQLGKDEYFVAGDARSSSSDSRAWGPVKIDGFRAKALLRYWPPKSFGPL